MLPSDFIRTKRDGGVHSKDAIEHFIKMMVEGTVADYQLSAWLMATFLNGMNSEETAALTHAMMRSGDVAELSHIQKPRVDKHSTGGVGDKVSLILAPLAAACGLCVPMMSGRGLGHTGGTLDKLDSIPGFSWKMPLEAYARQCEEIDCALIGQTDGMVPADKQLYALRDVTSTVESIPLIAASIMSKKLAEGIEGLVLDVKVGKGAFMKTLADAQALADAMIGIGEHLGCKVRAVLTRMDQPLGCAVGNALEVREAIDCLEGIGPEDITSLSVDLVAHMLVVGGIVTSFEAGQTLARSHLENGSAARKWEEIIAAQGGPETLAAMKEALPVASVTEEIRYSGGDGIVIDVDAMAIAHAALHLGCGRATVDSQIDYAAGFSHLIKIGSKISKGDLLGVVHARNESLAIAAKKMVIAAIAVESLQATETQPLIIEVLPK